MKIYNKIIEIKSLVRHWRTSGYSVGFVPTMGYLHKGHASLIQQACAENDKVIVSIFVNPTQFGENEDLDDYPRDLEKDVLTVEQYGGDAIFHPASSEMYPTDFFTQVNVGVLTEGLCGKSRPTHFSGVTTVVTKLFHIVSPNRAYFGEKDAQQLAVIRKMTLDLNMDIQIISCPIIREADGLAMSSRNAYLSQEERGQAAVLFQALQEAHAMFSSGVRDTQQILAKIQVLIEAVPLATIDYIEIVDSESLLSIDRIEESALLALAVYIGKTRLIDNTTLGRV